MNEKSLKAINEAKGLMLEMKHEAEKYSKLLELSRKNFLEEIRNNIPAKYYMYLDLIKQSWKNFHEGRKDCYDYLIEKLSNDLGIENLKIIETISYGYDGYAFEVKFSFLDKEYKLTIPDVAYIISDNIENCNEGKMVLFIKSGESFWSEVARSYDFDDFRKYFSGKVI